MIFQQPKLSQRILGGILSIQLTGSSIFICEFDTQIRQKMEQEEEEDQPVRQVPVTVQDPSNKLPEWVKDAVVETHSAVDAFYTFAVYRLHMSYAGHQSRLVWFGMPKNVFNMYNVAAGQMRHFIHNRDDFFKSTWTQEVFVKLEGRLFAIQSLVETVLDFIYNCSFRQSALKSFGKRLSPEAFTAFVERVCGGLTPVESANMDESDLALTREFKGFVDRYCMQDAVWDRYRAVERCVYSGPQKILFYI
jgi:hypothetical protein